MSAPVADVEVGWPDDLAGLPPTLVLLAEHDVLRPEGHALADALQGAGVDVVATQFHGVHHGFFRHPTVFTASRVAIDQVGTARSAVYNHVALSTTSPCSMPST